MSTESLMNQLMVRLHDHDRETRAAERHYVECIERTIAAVQNFEEFVNAGHRARSRARRLLEGAPDE